MKPELSVIIPLYNRADTILHTLDSIAVQNMNLEIIIVDDVSTDNGIDCAKQWSKTQTTPLKILQNKEKLGTLHSRIKGFKEARADDIIFMDADDIWLGEDRMLKALRQKQERNCDMLNFRANAITPHGEKLGEFLMAAPLYIDETTNFFDAYCKRIYLPCVVWNKIISKTLMNEVLPLIEKERIFRMEDAFLTSLLMVHANTYELCEEYIYQYTLSEYWPMEKFAGRIHDLNKLWTVIKPIMLEKNVKKETIENFKKFITQRIIVYSGKMCIGAEKMIFNKEKSVEEIYSILSQYLDDDLLFALTLFSTQHNAQTIQKKFQRIRYVF